MIRSLSLAVLVLAGAGIAVAAGWRPLGPAGEGSPGYRTDIAEIATIRRTISATGSLEAGSTVDVSSQLSGQVAQVAADFNDAVAAGQTLAQLDRRGFEARVAQAEAEAEIARETVEILAARLERAERVETEAVARRRVFEARTDRARVERETAQRELARARTLAERGATTATAVEDAEANLAGAEADLREAEALAAAHEHEVASSEAGRREAHAELASARAAIPLKRAALSLARLDLERSTIRAPIDGVVVGRSVEPGQTVAVSLDAPVLFTIAGDLSEMEIHANIDETDIGEIALGQAARFTVHAHPGRVFEAEVTEIRKAARLVGGVVTYTVVLETGNPDGLLLPGMTALVRIVVEEAGPVLTVPLAALRYGPEEDRDGVWVMTADGPERRALSFGADDLSRIAVTGGALAPGERVVTGRVEPSDETRLFGIRF